MKTLLLTLVISALSFTANAKTFGDWEVSSNGAKTTYSLEYPNSVWVFMATPSHGGKPAIYFRTSSNSCTRFEPDVMDSPPSTINGTLVQLYAQCVGNGAVVYFARTDAGSAYLFKEFSTSNKVVVDDVFTFSTKGFNEIYKYVIPKGI